MTIPKLNVPEDNLDATSVVCILERDQVTPAGAGFFVSKELILTCAHVLGDSIDEVLSKTVYLRTCHKEVLEAQIEPAYWRDPNHEDVAVLRLIQVTSSVNFLRVGSSENTKGHKFETYGFPKNHPSGLEGKGEIGGLIRRPNGYSLIQLTTGQVVRGYSGAPIFDKQTRCVVGMVSEKVLPDYEEVKLDRKDKEKTAIPMGLQDVVLATPSLTLLDICKGILSAGDICPYQSLSAFKEEDAEFFCGRDNLVLELVNQLRSNPRFLAVTGASGSGKSSVVKAKLLPKIKNGEVVGFDKDTPIVKCRLGDAGTPEVSLLNALGSLEKSYLPLSFWRIEAGSLNSLVKPFPTGRLVIFIDQFEELFTSYIDKSQSFLQELAHMLDNWPHVTLILTVRTEFDPQLRVFPLGERFNNGHLGVEAFQGKHLDVMAAIIQPAQKVGLELEAGLAQRIYDDLDKTQNPLPLLEFTLTQLWKFDVKEEQRNYLTHTAYEHIGRVFGALTQWANDVYEYEVTNLVIREPKTQRTSRSDKRKILIRQIFARLIHFGSAGAPDTRCRATCIDLEDLGEDVPELLEQLKNARLLVSDNQEVEIIHDALITQWLYKIDEGNWLRDQRQFRLWHQRFQEEQQSWESNHEWYKYLLSGVRLGTAEEYLKGFAAELTEPERRYIEISQRKRNLTQSIILTLVVGSLTAFFILWRNAESQKQIAEEQRETAKSVQLATASEASLETDTTRSLFLALIAVQTKVTPAAERALWTAFQANHEKSYLEHNGGNVTYGEYDPTNDDRILTISDQTNAAVWNTANPISPCYLNGHTGIINDGHFNPGNPQQVITVSADSTGIIWDVNTCKQTMQLKGHKAPIHYANFDPRNPNRVLTASSDKTAMLWDLTKPDKPQHLQGHTREVWKAEFDPNDSNRALTISSDGTARIWNLKTLENSVTLRGHRGQVTYGCFNPKNSNQVLTVSDDRTARVWNLNDTSTPIILKGHEGKVVMGAFSPHNSDQVMTVSEDSTVRLWNIKNPNEFIVLRAGIDQVAYASFNSKIPNQILLVGSDGSIGKAEVWNTQDLQNPKVQYKLVGHRSKVHYGTFSLKNPNQILTTGSDSTARVWDISSRALLETKKENGIIVRALFAPKKQGEIITVNKNGFIQTWSNTGDNWDRGEQNTQLPTAFDSIISADFNPRNLNELVTVDSQGHSKIWSLSSLTSATEIPAGNDKILTAAYSSKDPRKILFINDNGTLVIRDVSALSEKSLVISLLPSRIGFANFAPNDPKKVITANDSGIVDIWSLEDLSKPQASREVEGDIFWFAGFGSNLSDKIFTGGKNGKLWVWNLDSKASATELVGHKSTITYGASNPNNPSQVITTGLDGYVNIWNLELLNKPISIVEPREEIIYGAFSPYDQNQILTLSKSGALRIYLVGGKQLFRDSWLGLSRCLNKTELKDNSLTTLDTNNLLLLTSNFNLGNANTSHKLYCHNEKEQRNETKEISSSLSNRRISRIRTFFS